MLATAQPGDLVPVPVKWKPVDWQEQLEQSQNINVYQSTLTSGSSIPGAQQFTASSLTGVKR